MDISVDRGCRSLSFFFFSSFKVWVPRILAVSNETILRFNFVTEINFCINILCLFPSFVCMFPMDYVQLGKDVILQNREHSNAFPERK